MKKTPRLTCEVVVVLPESLGPSSTTTSQVQSLSPRSRRARWAALFGAVAVRVPHQAEPTTPSSSRPSALWDSRSVAPSVASP